MSIQFDKNLQFSQSNGNSKRIEEKLRYLSCLPRSQYLSLKQVCEFYEVEPNEVRSILKTCTDEFRDENVVSVSENTQNEFVRKYGKCEVRYCEPTSEMWDIVNEDGEVIQVPKFAVLMFPVRAVRRMGMLLSGMVAEALKNEILNRVLGL